LELSSISQVVLRELAVASSLSNWADNRSNPEFDWVGVGVTSVRPDSPVDVSILIWEFTLASVDNSSISEVVCGIAVAVIIVVVVRGTTISCVDFKRSKSSFNGNVVVSSVWCNSLGEHKRSSIVDVEGHRNIVLSDVMNINANVVGAIGGDLTSRAVLVVKSNGESARSGSIG